MNNGIDGASTDLVEVLPATGAVSNRRGQRPALTTAEVLRKRGWLRRAASRGAIRTTLPMRPTSIGQHLDRALGQCSHLALARARPPRYAKQVDHVAGHGEAAKHHHDRECLLDLA